MLKGFTEEILIKGFLTEGWGFLKELKKNDDQPRDEHEWKDMKV